MTAEKEKHIPPGKGDGMAPRMQKFADFWLANGNAKASYIAAGYTSTGNSAEATACKLLKHPKVASYIAKKQQELSKKLGLDQEKLLQELWQTANADPRELVEYRIGCCRYCWGKGYRYQRTAGEFERDKAAHAANKLAHPRKAQAPFNPQGGIGYLRTNAPNPECPECAGEGLGRTVVKDTKNLSIAAASLYAGLKETKDGFEIKLHSRDAAQDKLMRHLGLYKDKVDVNVEGDFVKAMLNARSRAAKR